MICEEIINILKEQSPEEYACDWDNVGLLVGSREKDIQSIYIALDATDETIQEAVEAGADMLLTHHPMIFKGLKKVNTEDFIGRRVIELIKHDMAYYAMHTNFDVAGMADLAGERMQLHETQPLQPTGEEMGIGKVGRLSDIISLQECVERTKEAFDVDLVKVFADTSLESWQQKNIEKVAICPGSGKSVIRDALKAGAQVLITGDIDHHEGIDAAACGMSVIDAGHYGVEKIFIPYMEQYLKKALPGVKVIAQEPKKPFVIV